MPLCKHQRHSLRPVGLPGARATGLLACAALALALALAGCAGALPSPAASPDWRAPPGQALLLGEVHDNAAQHALRAQALAALLAQGDRPALLMEQFDRERQGAIDATLQAAHRATGQAADTGASPGGPLPDAALDALVDALVQAGGGPGWHWPFYKPYLKLALRHGLPVVAANVSRAEARLVMQQGLAAQGWQADVPADIARAQAGAILQGHCGQLDAATAARLAQAQVARDQFMARLVALHAPRGVVLLAGNGHVRADVGVPRWLSAPLRERTRVVGALEAGDASDSAFDTVLRTAAQPRSDPCAGLQMPALPPAVQPAPAPAPATQPAR